ncbi:hypothetical protein AVEN_66114-1 [Araneus ventricosus]|uniref:Gustatory receptor n=1 Tax=Araneus ventricosus TaxID=182803 RepID=A0A4Y2G3Y9_ARAVE|nr:hypothetical protein AVEN_66114-1 [Araneus ventricosus]
MFEKLRRKSLNYVLISILSISVVLSAISALTMSKHRSLKLYYSFFVYFQEDVIGITVRFCINQLIFAYQYAYPCIIAMVYNVLYYDFSEFLFRFHEKLLSLQKTLNRNEIMVIAKAHCLFFETVHQIQDSTALICFFFLCSQMTVLYGTLSVFVLTKTEDISVPQICENVLIILLVPASIIRLVLSASRISEQNKKIQITILVLKDRLIRQSNTDLETVNQLNLMKERQFPVISAAGFAELSPKFMLSMFGSLFTYGLLIINLKHE